MRAPAADRRRDAASERDSRRLRVPSPLSAGLRALPRRAARAARRRLDTCRLLAARHAATGGGMKPVTAPTPLVEVRDLAKRFDVSAPWLNRVVERKPRQFVHA